MGFISVKALCDISCLSHGRVPLLLLSLLCVISITVVIAKLLRKRRLADMRLPLFKSEAASPTECPQPEALEPPAAPPPPPPSIEVLEHCVSEVAGASATPQTWFFAIVRDTWLLAEMRAAEPQLVEAPYVVALFMRGGEAPGNMTGKLITGLHKAGLCTLPHTPKNGAHIRSLLWRSDTEVLQVLLPIFSSGAPGGVVGGSYELGDLAAVY